MGVDSVRERRPPEIIRSTEEPEWAHVWADMPGQGWRPVADLHLPCNSVTGISINTGAEGVRHLCRECLRDEAQSKERE